ncbi:MAG: InlB B-repeat-containing protein [Lachnospiraceae bacterium]
MNEQKKAKQVEHVKKRRIQKSKKICVAFIAVALLITTVSMPRQAQASPVSNEPIRWRVLSTQSEDTGYTSGGMLLMSDQALDYRDGLEEWTNISSWLQNTFLPTAFSASEQTAIVASNKSEGDMDRVYDSSDSYYLGECSLNAEKLFLLSASEVTNQSYGFTKNDLYGANSKTRQLSVTDYAMAQGALHGDGNTTNWGLRSHYSVGRGDIGLVDWDGALYTHDALDSFYGNASVVAAFNVNLSSVLFSSAAEGSKSTSLTEPSAYTGNAWRLTIEDDTQSVEVGEAVTFNAGMLTIPYTFTESLGGGLATKLSVMITNQEIREADAEVLYYGQVKELMSAGEGEVQVIVPEAVINDGGCVYLFSETNYGDKMTDYASTPVLAKTFSGDGAEASGTIKDVMLGIQGIHNPQEPADNDAPWGNGAGSYVWFGTYEQDNIPNPSPSPTPSATASPTPSATTSPTPSATTSPTPSATAGPTPSTTVTPSVKPTPTTISAKKFTVTYQANSGKIGTAFKVTKTVTYGKKYVVPANPSRTNFTFQGWYTAKTGGTKVTKNTTVKLTKNQTLYAHWKAESTVVAGKQFTVTYNAGAGKIGKVQKVTKKVTNSKKYVLPANPTRDCYVFQGWYTSANGGKKVTKSTTVQLTKNQTLYARWAVGTAPVFCLYNPNSGEHFYTITASERDEVIAAGWKYEGISWIAALDGHPVFRVYNTVTGEHIFSMDTKERDRLLALGWKDEGIGFYSDVEKKHEILRCYNPNGEPAAQHHYTLSKAERDNLVKAGWIYEGLAWFAK